jgi:PEGA domain-containing protein
LLVSLLVWQPGVRAEDADALLRQGVALRKERKDREAFELFQRAVGIQKTPRALGQLGLCEQALGLWPKAESHIKEALDAAGDPWIKKNRSTLEESMRAIGEHLGSLEIWGDPADAEVLFNGRPVGALPATGPVRLEIGQVTVTVRAKGYADAIRAIDVKSGDSLRENVTLVATAPAPIMPPLAPAPSATEQTPSLVAQPGATAGEASDRPVYARWWFWTAVGAAAAGGIATAILLGRGHSSPCDANAAACTTWGS